jgi:Fe-S cluster assembly scaffold protein SufB
MNERILEIYCVEWDGEFYRSVFPAAESELAELHTTVEDALDYFTEVKPGVKVEVLT